MLGNVLVYPYDAHFTPLLRTNTFIEKCNIIHLCSLSGWGLCGKDAAIADGGEKLSIIVDNEFDSSLLNSDTVIFTESDNPLNYEDFFYPKLYKAIAAKKRIINLIPLESEKFEKIKETCDENNVHFEHYVNSCDFNLEAINSEEGILNINVPVIMILGLSSETGKFSTQLEIKTNLEKMGYKVCLIGSRSYCEFLNFHSFPNFMSQSNYTESEKIYLFNRYIKDLEKIENPDVIVISVPGGIVPYDQKINNNFGITSFLVSQALTPDASVLCLYHEEYTSEYLSLIANTVKYRFGFEIDAFNIINRQIDWVEMINAKPGKIRFSTINPNLVDKRIAESSTLTDVPLYNYLDKSGELSNMLVDKLSQNSNSVTF